MTPDRYSFTRASLLALFLALSLQGFAGAAYGDICKYADSEGRVIYSNLPVKGAKRLSCDVTLDPSPSGGKSARNDPSPSGFPKVDPGTQRNRDDTRRKILEEELANEEKLLVEARSAFRGGAPEKLAEEQGNEAKYRDRVGKLKQNLAVHEKNVDALKQELAKLK